MKFCLDTHTHTIASGHAYSTITEMIETAKAKGLSLLAITDHAPNMPGSTHRFYFDNMRVFKGREFGIEVLFGVELNILDQEGHVDFEDQLLEKLGLRIASIHGPCFKIGTNKENTDAYINAMKNRRIDIIGHPDDGRIPIDYPRLIEAAKKYDIALELNNSSLSPKTFRQNALENALTYVSLCKEYGVPITLGTDAHVCYDIGEFPYAEQVLEQVDFPEELILNTSLERFKNYLITRRNY